MSLFLLLLIMSTEYLRISLSHEVSQNDATLIDLLLKYKIATVEQKYDFHLEIIGKKLDHLQDELENLKTKQKEIENDIIHEDVKSTLIVDIQSQIAQETSTRYRHENEIQALQSGFRSIKTNIRSIQTAFFEQKSIIKNISLWECCEKKVTGLERLEEHPKQTSSVTIYKDCTDVGDGKSGVYKIQPLESEEAFDVYCDMNTDGGGWTVFQRRQDGSENFYRGWADYETGFGSLTGEFWLGDGMAYHNQRPFSTRDRDNDAASYSCAVQFKGAWWYNACHASNLNGQYLPGVKNMQGVTWYPWKGHYYSFKTTEIKIRKIA